jgi:hypothetical protein
MQDLKTIVSAMGQALTYTFYHLFAPVLPKKAIYVDNVNIVM